MPPPSPEPILPTSGQYHPPLRMHALDFQRELSGGLHA